MSRPAPTSRGWSTGVLGFCALAAGLWLGYPDLAAIGLVLVAAVALSWLALLRSPSVTGERRLTSRVVARDAACEAVITVSAGRSATSLIIVDHCDDAAVEVEIAGTPAGAGSWSGAGRWAVPTHLRGSLRIGPAVAHRPGLGGLAAIDDIIIGAERLVVLPRVRPTSAIPSTAMLNRVGTHRLADLGGTDLISLRAYQPGDDLRRLSWAASARTGSLMLREDGEPGSAELTVLLDDAVESASPAEFEEMVDVAASLAAAAIGSGSPVTVLSTSRRLRTGGQTAAGPPGAAREEVMLALAVAGQHAESLTRAAAEVWGDVVIAVGGPGSSLPELLGAAQGAAWRGAVVVDGGSERRVARRGQSYVVYGRDAGAALASWDSVR